MKKKTITITAPVSIINALGFILVPVSTQKVLSESIYLKIIREAITICFS